MSGEFLADGTRQLPLGVIGGKGAGLVSLRALGLDVPPFLILTADAFRSACPEGRIPDGLPEAIDSELRCAWERLGAGSPPLAARSSAVDEDGVERSFAGQMESFLNIRTLPALRASVLGCWRSLDSERARVYRESRELRTAGSRLAMAVVLQQMADPQVSGVAFTVNPVSGRTDEMLVSSVWGLGEGLVSGALDADTFVLDRAGQELSRTIAVKRERVARKAEGGTGRIPVPQERWTLPTLDKKQLAELAGSCLKVEADAGRPQDIEFCIQDGRLYLLQARPVTRFTPRRHAGRRLVWDNSNIIESYAGITLPLTFSFIRRAYHAVYRQSLALLGLGAAELQQHEDELWNMLGLIRGRVYYNLVSWYRMLTVLPGFEYNKRFHDVMMGFRQVEEIDPRPSSWFERHVFSLPALARTGFRAWGLHRTLPHRVREFHRHAAGIFRQYADVDFDREDAPQLWAVFRELEGRLMWKWSAPTLNDCETMVFFGVLKKLTDTWKLDPDGSLVNALLSGQGGLESTQVTDQLLALVRAIAGDPALPGSFSKATATRGLRMIERHPDLGPAFRDYLARYGDRAVEELKLESRTMKDDPEFCIAMMQNYLRTGTYRLTLSGSREEMRRHALELLEERLSGRPIAGRIYRHVLDLARAAVRNRENQRLERTRAFALVRRVLRGMGNALVRRGTLSSPEDVFYLTLEEIGEFVEKGADRLRAIVEGRRAEYEAYGADQELPEHFVTYGDPAGGDFEIRVPRAKESGDLLVGLAACPGVVEAECVVLERPDRSIRVNGRILVARQTDPGWVVLFPSIRGLVVERGSLLSHSAIVAREMGIPAVVGVPRAYSRLRTGDRLRLDGAEGTVRILRRGRSLRPGGRRSRPPRASLNRDPRRAGSSRS